MATNTERDGQRIDALRVERGLTVLELATKSQIPLTTLQRRLADDGKLTIPEARRLSLALGVTLTDVLGVAA